MELGILGLIVFVLDIVAIIKILGSSVPSREKLLWILVIVLLPLFGLILWWAIGKKSG